MPVSKAQQQSHRKWNESNLDRLYITVPKGQKDIIKTIAETKGESLNSYINKAIQNQIERDTIKNVDLPK